MRSRVTRVDKCWNLLRGMVVGIHVKPVSIDTRYVGE